MLAYSGERTSRRPAIKGPSGPIQKLVLQRCASCGRVCNDQPPEDIIEAEFICAALSTLTAYTSRYCISWDTVYLTLRNGYIR
jgi:hypothetical protein